MATRDPNLPPPRFESLEPPRMQTPAGGGTPVPLMQTKVGTEKAVLRSRAAPVAVPPRDTAGDDAPSSPAPSPPLPPLKNAAAITYRSDAGPPRIVAKGQGLIAEQIIARAKEHGVAIHESRELVALLMQVELDDHIPPALYRAVAELLAWLYHIEAVRLQGRKVS